MSLEKMAITPAQKLIKEAAAEAIRIIEVAASKAAIVVKERSHEDHDILIELRTNMVNLEKSIKEIRDGNMGQITDHELRLRKVETAQTRLITWGTAIFVVLGIIEFLIIKFT